MWTADGSLYKKAISLTWWPVNGSFVTHFNLDFQGKE